MNSTPNRDQLLQAEEENPKLAKQRVDTALFVSASLSEFGTALEVSGYILGTDRKENLSPFGFGSDEVYGVSLLLRIGAELSDNTVRLFQIDQSYAAAALLRQIVEVEYLFWAFDQRDSDAETWLRSTKDDRWKIFRPAKLRAAAEGKFRAKDYGHHCDLGGHPTPSAITLLKNDSLVTQLLISDLLGHLFGIWGHFVSWGQQREELIEFFKHHQSRGESTGKILRDWKASDPLTGLGPPL